MAPVEPLAGGRAAAPEHVGLDQTTLPRHRRPELAPAPHLVVSVGDDAGRTADELLRAGDRHLPLDPGAHEAEAPGVAETVAAELTRLPTGWRVLAVGPERDVLAVRAAALAAGALDAEITFVPTDVRGDVPGDDDREGTRVRLVFCGACHRRFDARAAVRDRLACPACRAVLTLAAHHSRRHGAFLGVPVGRRV